MDEVLLHPLLLAWAERDLAETAGSFWLNTGQMMVVGPGSTTQMLHRDEGNWPFIERLGPTGPAITVSVMVALTPFTEEAGATRVVPGSHRSPDFGPVVQTEGILAPPELETVPAVMEAGSGLPYSGKLIHGAGANRTDAWRRGLHTSYVAGWLCPEEANPLAVPWRWPARCPNGRRSCSATARTIRPKPAAGAPGWSTSRRSRSLACRSRRLRRTVPGAARATVALD